MYTQFTWFEKITKIYESISDVEQRAKFAMAVIDFGTKGVETELEYPINVFFESIRDDIANSVNARTNNKGGRPKKHRVDPSADVAGTDGFSERGTGGFEEETMCSDEQKTGGFKEGETDENSPLYKPKPMPNPKPKDKKDGDRPPYDAIISYLNEKAGTSFRSTTKATQALINGRWREGYTLDDFKAVIDVKCADWDKDPKPGEKDSRAWLRPKTLFAASNFEGYLNQAMKGGGHAAGTYASEYANMW